MYSGTVLKNKLDGIFVVGPAGAGKTVFMRVLSDALGVYCAETGDVLLDYYAEYMARTDPARTAPHEALPAYESILAWRERILAEKSQHREQLRFFGDLMTGIKGDALIDAAILRAWIRDRKLPNCPQIIGGVRRYCEVEARLSRGRRDVWVRIERPGRKTQDGYELGALESFLGQLIYRQAGVHVIRNDGSLEQFKLEARGLAASLKNSFEF